MPQDIRKFFNVSKPSGNTGDGGDAAKQAAKPNAKQDVKAQTPKAATPAAAAAATSPKASKYFGGGSSSQPPATKPPSASPAAKRAGLAASGSKQPTPRGSGGGAGGAAAAKRPAAAKRKQQDSGSESEYEASSSSEEEDSDDDDVVVVSSDEEAGPEEEAEQKASKPAPVKRARTAAGAAPPPAKGTPSKAAPAKAAPARKAPRGGAKATRPQMEVVPHAKRPAAGTDGDGGGAPKRKLPGSVGDPLPEVTAPKRPKSATAKPALNADAVAAVAAVDAAAKKLPSLDTDTLQYLEGGGWGANAPDPTPASEGSKPLPRGHPEALTGKTFVFTGVLESTPRPLAQSFVERHGGRVTTSVSGRTSFVVVGTGCSRGKVTKAKENAGKGCRVIDEDGLLALVEASQAALPPDQRGAPSPGPPAAAAAAGGGGGGVTGGGGPGRSLAPLRDAAFAGASGAGPSAGAATLAGGARSSRAAPTAPRAPPPPQRDAAANSQLWVDKHKPKTSVDLIGNPGLVKTLRTWLTHWDAIHLQGRPPPPSQGAKPKDMTKKAVLISGPPGIGKTSSAHILARELGFTVVEVNASDTRSKADAKSSGGMAGKTSNQVKELVTSHMLSGFGADAGAARPRPLLIMDEVDGMSGGDRGGVADLIQTIHRTKIPIICICNDKYHQKLRSLRNHCMELDYRRPTVVQLVPPMMRVARSEGLQVAEAPMRALVEGAGGDIRLILGQLQMFRVRSASLCYDDAKSRPGKDAERSPFECAQRLLAREGASLSMGEQLDMAFMDDLVPLLVQENYINHFNPAISGSAPGNPQRLKALAKAAECISAGDVVNTSVRRYGNWGLMPFGAVAGTLMPAAYVRGPRESFNPYEQNFPRFTQYLGNFSTSSKQRRLMGELATNLLASGHVSGGRSAMRLDYVPALRTLLTVPLVEREDAGIPGVVELMQEYCINREQVDFIMDVTCASKSEKPELKVEAWKAVPTKVKAAFTRAFNKEGLRARTSAMVDAPVKGGGRGRGRAAAAADDGDGAPERMGLDADDAAALEEDGGGGGGSGSGAPQAGNDSDNKGEEEEEPDAAQLAQQLKGSGISVQLSGGGSGARGGRGSGGRGGRGRGSGGGARGGRGGSGRGSGGAGGSGRGKGRGK